MGHCKLSEVVPRLMKCAGISGYFTNHLLRVTAATRLYDARVDEDTVMQRSGHRSSQGVRMYKRQTEKLKELSSNVLKQVQDTKKMKLDDIGDQSISDGCEKNPTQFLKSFQIWNLAMLQTSLLTLTSTSN